MPGSTICAWQGKVTNKMLVIMTSSCNFFSINMEHHFGYFFFLGFVISIICVFFIIENFRIKKIAQALKESKEKYLIATKNADFSIWEFDLVNQRLLQSHHSKEVHGNLEVIENVTDFIIESGYVIGEDIDKFREFYGKICAGEPSADAEFWVKTSTRAERWYERLSYTMIYDKQGKPIKAIGSSKDITKEKEVEKKYKEEIYYRTCVDKDVIGSFHFNLTKNWCGDGQSNTKEILLLQESQTVDGFFEADYKNNADPELLEEYKKVFNRQNLIKSFREGDSQLSFDRKYYLDNGQKVCWITTFIFMIENIKTGDIEGFIYSRNINNQKINEQIMRTVIGLEYDFITVINGIDNTFFLYETNQDSTLPSTENNNYDQTVLDYAQKFVFGEDKTQYVHDSLLSEIRKQLEGNSSYVVYYRVKEPSGKIKCKKSYYAYMDIKDKTIIGTRVDITQIFEREEKTNELLKNALAAAEQANKAKSIFLSSMSHDIRTPMNAIVGMTKIAMKDIDKKESVINSLKVIESSGKHLLDIINDILDMSRIESGKLVFAEEEYDLIKLIEDIKSINKPLIDEKQQIFEVKLINVQHYILKGDELKLRQVIINLLSNANKFTPKGGYISLIVEEIKLTQDRGVHFRFTVEDNGLGIPKESQEEIFNPFSREGIGAINNIEGTGLGLSIVKNMIEARGGRIWVESEVGKGSKFVFEFASIISNKSISIVEEKEHKQVDTDIDCTGIKILLVEDNEINIMVATQLFENIGAIVDSAVNGSIGYDKFVSSSDGDFDIIIMDIQMPVMNGYEATKAIRESNHKQALTIPIVAMSADVFAEDITKARMAGMNAHLGKPLDMSGFFEIISDLGLGNKNKYMA
jgi:signal transduction histidine kinase